MKSVHIIRALLMVSVCQLSIVSIANGQSTNRKQSGLSADDDSMKRLLEAELGSAPGFDISAEAKAFSGKNQSKRGLMDSPKEVAGGLVPNQTKGFSTGESFRPGAGSFNSGFDGIEVKQMESLGRLPKESRMLNSDTGARQGADLLVPPAASQFSFDRNFVDAKKIWKGER